MKALMRRLLVMAVTYALIWLGFVEGVNGAQNVVHFYTWVIAVPIGLLCLHDKLRESIAKDESYKPRPVLNLISGVLDWSALGLFVWTGHIVLALGWSLSMFLMASLKQGVAELRKKAASA